MPLITDIATVRLSGVNVQFINDNSSIADMTAAELKYIEPILGADLYQLLLQEPTGETSGFDELRLKVQRALAPLAYYLDLPNIQAQITDRGAATFTSENMRPLHRWEYEALRESLADKGSFALEKLLEHLNQHKADYGWQMPGDLKTIFLGGLHFAKFFPVYQPHRTFALLQPIVKQIEELYIKPTIGEEFFLSLGDKEDPNEHEAIALNLLRTAIAALTIHTATEMLPVRISTNGFTVALLDTIDLPTQGQAQAPNTQMSVLHDSTKRNGELYLVKLKSFLNTTASDTVFAQYKNSIYYTSPSTTFNNPNASRTGIFGL